MAIDRRKTKLPLSRTISNNIFILKEINKAYDMIISGNTGSDMGPTLLTPMRSATQTGFSCAQSRTGWRIFPHRKATGSFSPIIRSTGASANRCCGKGRSTLSSRGMPTGARSGSLDRACTHRARDLSRNIQADYSGGLMAA